jgi:hypothetical protein
VVSARRKCLFLYFYFIHRDFGLMHVKLQTWFPLQIQVYVNGHEWLARDKRVVRATMSRNFDYVALFTQGRVFVFVGGTGSHSRDSV